MTNDKAKGKTGIFYVQNPAGVVMMVNGEVRHRYRSVDELIETHTKGMIALERELEDVLRRQYLPEGPG
jgi:hypothetical protein